MSLISWDIQYCPLTNGCFARWQKLEPIQGEARIRYCEACQRSVYLCQTEEELVRHRALGRCVALQLVSVGSAQLGG